MNWPTSQDYNEAIQNATTCLSDPDLKNGEPTVNAMGLPVPRSGNFADVYQVKGADGKMWAVKCFTRHVEGLQERYTKINEYLEKAKLPFTVGFNYFAEGVKIRGKWYPLLKMEWVEGFTLNEFVRNNADKPNYLHGLMQMWAKLTGKLRDADIAHADLQHGNVLLVPGNTPAKLGLKLIDYDGMWVPPLADRHSGEVGHPNFQHPSRLKDRLFNADVDRFPHLVIACALRATLVGGKSLWQKFDNGDNLLFREQDLRDPANAKIFKTLWDLNDGVVRTLVGHIALSTRQPLRKTPWLDDVLFEEYGPRLSPDLENQTVAMLGVAPPLAKTVEVAVPDEFGDFDVLDDDEPRAPEDHDETRRRPATKSTRKKPLPQKKSKTPLLVGGGVLGLALIGALIAMFAGGKKDPPSLPVVQIEDRGDGEKQKPIIGPKGVPKDSKDPNPKDSKPKESEPKDPNPGKNPPIAGGADRRAAEWVLSIGGRVRLNNRNDEFAKVTDLPNDAFQLTSVSIIYSKNMVTDEGLGVFKGCKNLTRLDLMQAEVGDKGLANFSNCKNLIHLNLFSLQFTDDGLANFRACRDLTSLRLQLPRATDDGLAHFNECKNLNTLQLYLDKVTDAGLANFQDCKNLNHLELSLANVTGAGLAVFSECKNVKFLQLRLPKAGDAALAHFQDFDPAVLSLQTTNFSEEGLAVFKNCRNIVALHLANSQVTDSGLANFGNCKNLATLELSNTKIGDSGLAAFRECEKLHALYLASTKISDAGLSSVKDCKNLTVLDLQSTGVTDSGLAHFKDCAKLQSINLYGTQVSASGVKELLAPCKPRYLDLRRTKVTAMDVAELKKSLTECQIPWDAGVVGPQKGGDPALQVNREIMTLKSEIDFDPGETHKIRLSSDGKLVCTTKPNEVTIHDAATGKKLNTFPTVDRGFWSVCFGQDNQELYLVPDKGTLQIWDWAKGKHLADYDGVGVLHVQLLKDRRNVLLMCGGGALVWWDAEKRREITRIPTNTNATLQEVCPFPDGDRFLLNCNEKGLKLLDRRKNPMVVALEGLPEVFFNAGVSPNGKWIVACTSNQPYETYVLDARNCKLKFKLVDGRQRQTRLAGFTQGGDYAVTSHTNFPDWSFIDLKQGKIAYVAPSVGTPRTSTSLTSDGLLASVDEPRQIRVWKINLDDKPPAKSDTAGEPDGPKNPAKKMDREEKGLVKTSERLSGLVGAMAFSSDGKKIFAATNSGVLHVLDASSLDEIVKHKIPGEKPRQIVNAAKVTLPSGAVAAPRIYLLDEEKKICLIDTEKGSRIKELDLDKLQSNLAGQLISMSLTADGKTLVVTNHQGFKPIFWDTTKWAPGSLNLRLNTPDLMRAIGYSHDFKIGAMWWQDKMLVWNNRTGQDIRVINVDFLNRINIIPEASVVVGEDYTKRRAWNYSSGKELWVLKLHGNNVLIAPIPKKPGFVSAGGNTVGVWDAVSGTEVVSWKSDQFLTGLVVSPDGKYAATAHGFDNRIKLWSLPAVISKKP